MKDSRGEKDKSKRGEKVELLALEIVKAAVQNKSPLIWTVETPDSMQAPTPTAAQWHDQNFVFIQ